MSNPILLLNKLGQSIWYDNIQRKLIENGELASLIENGEVRGITSNPSIFHNAIAKSSDYDSFLIPLAWSGKDADGIFWDLAIEDIRAAADLLSPLYESSNKLDGYVSLEVSPLLANDTQETIAQAKLLWARVNRPNLMIKIPATEAGIPAVTEVIAEGINVNVTLIFSLSRYAQVMDAYITGLEKRVLMGQPLGHIASVASFFVSRVDTKVDGRLNKAIEKNPSDAEEMIPLLGKASIANAKLAYAAFEKVFTSERFAKLRANHSAQIQRPLWASTSTKNPEYPDTLYVDELIGPDTVNTMPPQTLDAFRDHGTAEVTLTRNILQAEEYLRELDIHGIDLNSVTTELEIEGVKSFADAFTALLETIESRRKKAADQLNGYLASVSRRISRMELDQAPQRLHAKDPSLWTMDPAGQLEIKNRLGWLKAVHNYSSLIPELVAFKKELQSSGFVRVLLLGMGGSSLAPEVLANVFDDISADGLKLSILDSTDPAQVALAASSNPPEKTLYIVSSKSGGTAEVSAMFDYFWELSGQNGSQFIAITDPGTALEAQAKKLNFRKVFHGDPAVGGRFSALTPFGLVPAALIGIDLEKFLARAGVMVDKCDSQIAAWMNPGVALGGVLGQMALDGREKLTVMADSALAPFGAWLEQLIDESSGKDGRGIVVVEGEGLLPATQYGNDRLFVYLRLNGELDSEMEPIRGVGHPVIVIDIQDIYELGAEFYRWEVATAIACAVMGVNAFDQPDVQLSKDITKKKIAQYAQSRALDAGQPNWVGDSVSVYSPNPIDGGDIYEVIITFLSSAERNDFVGINAYVPRDPSSKGLLSDLRLAVGKTTGCATTLGFGPRFLHSTGQLHKGGENIGVFLQITIDPKDDLIIPNQNMTFGTLESAQALGDYEALQSRGRRIMRLQFSSWEKFVDVVQSMK